MVNQATKNIPNGWKETTLGEVGITITGKTPSKDNPKDWGNLLDFITPTDIISESKYLKDVARKLSKEGVDRFQKMIIPSGSVVVTCIGSVGKVVINKHRALTNQQINSIKVNTENDKDYIYYFLKNSYGVLRNIAVGGSTMPILNKSTFESLEIRLPSLAEQKAIAAVLSSFDDKIELLREQNKILESTAQTIFKEWFVNFEFPSTTPSSSDATPPAEGNSPSVKGCPKGGVVGYKSSGGKMIDSELGPIPTGWQIGKLGGFGQIVCGKTPPKSNAEFFGGEIPFIKIPDMHNQIFITKTEDSLSQFGAHSQKNKFIPKNSVCVSCIATVGLVSITSQDSQTNQQINSIIIGSEDFLEYLYFSLCEMKNDLLAIGSGGSATLNINTTTFSNIKILKPGESLLVSYHTAMKPIFEKILSNREQIQTLSKIRDTLLPKLMTGQIRARFN